MIADQGPWPFVNFVLLILLWIAMFAMWRYDRKQKKE